MNNFSFSAFFFSLPGILVLFLLLLLVMIIYIYNKLIVLSKRTEEAFSDIDVQLKRRHDLIPNLVETVKAYAKHEKELFENVAHLRSQAISAHSLSEKSEAENLLSQALKSIFALVENYPDLKASQNFQELQRELADTEDKIQAARRFYNSCVLDLNTNIEVFPQNIIARLFNISKREFFEIKEEKEREPVKVDFD